MFGRKHKVLLTTLSFLLSCVVAFPIDPHRLVILLSGQRFNPAKIAGLVADWGAYDAQQRTLSGTAGAYTISELKDSSWTSGRLENLLLYSEDISQAVWGGVGRTKNDATHFTITAQDGRVQQSVTTIEGVSYVFTFTARAVTGNTSLKFYHASSASGDTSPLTLTATLTTYSVTVLGKTGGGAVSFGIQDTNAAGFGQIEVTAWQVRLSTSSSTYYKTTTIAETAARSVLQGTAANQPILSRTDSSGNGFKYSEDISQSAWLATSGTKNDATHFTFTAQNGRITQDVNTTPGKSYKLFFTARAVSGNTALKFYHNNSATGNTTDLTLTAPLADYSVTVLGRAAGGAVTFGIQDVNAAGFGQIEVTKWYVVETTWNDIYIATTALPALPGLNGLATAYFDGTAHYLKTGGMASLVQPTTVVMVCKQWTWTSNDGIFDGNAGNSMRLYQQTSTPRVGSFDGTNTTPGITTWNLGDYAFIAEVFNGASTLLYRNNDSSATGTQTGNGQGFTIGAKGDATSFGNIQVARILVYNRALNASELDYLKAGLAKQWGLTL